MFSFDVFKYEPLFILLTSAILSVLYYLQIDDKENLKSIFIFNGKKKERDKYIIETKCSDEKTILTHVVMAFMIIGIIIGISNYYPVTDKRYFFEVDFMFIFAFIAIALISYYIFNLTKYTYNRIAILKQLNIVSTGVSLIEYLLLRFWEPNLDKKFTLYLLIGVLINISLHYLLATKKFVPLENEPLLGYKEKPINSKSDLVFSRKNQLEYLISEFRKIASDEPYAIMLDGKWGQGKTSLINALMSEDNEFCFVYVSVGYSVNSKAILDDIEKQIRNIFEKENYYCEQKGDIYNYFRMMCKLSAVTVDERIGKIYDAFINDGETIKDTKKELNSFLNGFYAQTGKRIIVIIDDLERCHPLNIKSIFSLLLETCKLDNCLTLLVCDYKRLLDTEAVNEEYLDKYINRKYSLTFIKPFDVFSQIVKKDLDSSANNYDWEMCYEDIEFIIDKIEEFADDLKTANAYSINKDLFVYFKSYTLRLKEKINNMLSNPRTAKKIWVLGIKKGNDVLYESELRGGAYKDIRVPAVATIYGLLLYGLTNIYDEIVGLKGITQYKKYFRSISDVYHTNEEMIEQYFDYVIFIRLLEFFMPKEVMALDWLLLLKDTTKLSDYKTDKEIYTEQWRDVNTRNIGNFDFYIEYLEFDSYMLIEMIDFLYGNIRFVSSQYLEKYYACFINTYDETNDEKLQILSYCFMMFCRCCDFLTKINEKDNTDLYGLANDFKDYAYMICYGSIAESVWIITLHSLNVDKLDTAEIYRNVKDKRSYLKFLKILIENADIPANRKNEFNAMTNRYHRSVHKSIKEITDFVVDVCINENKSYLTDESRERKIILAKIADYCNVISGIGNGFTIRVVSKKSNKSNLFEALGNDPVKNTEDILTLLTRINNSWNSIDHENKASNCDRVMRTLGEYSRMVIDRADSCDYKERIKLRKIINLILSIYKLYKEIMPYRDFEKYAEVLFLIEAARKKIYSQQNKIRKEHDFLQKTKNNIKADS